MFGSDRPNHVTSEPSLVCCLPTDLPAFVLVNPARRTDSSDDGATPPPNADIMHLNCDIAQASSPAQGSFRFIHRSNMVLGVDEYLRSRFHRDDGALRHCDVSCPCEPLIHVHVVFLTRTYRYVSRV